MFVPAELKAFCAIPIVAVNVRSTAKTMMTAFGIQLSEIASSSSEILRSICEDRSFIPLFGSMGILGLHVVLFPSVVIILDSMFWASFVSRS